MDCEKFDRIVLDLLYGELDELTEAAAKRHIEHCSRCKGVSSGLRATREVGALALVDPPDSLELGILEAERRMNAKLPLAKKLERGVSILAVYAMRPQLAMAALLLLMIGSSLFFLRGRAGAPDSVLVTERGVPETEAEHVAIVAAPEPRDAPAVAAASAMPKLAGAKAEADRTRARHGAEKARAKATAQLDDACERQRREGRRRATPSRCRAPSRRRTPRSRNGRISGRSLRRSPATASKKSPRAVAPRRAGRARCKRSRPCVGSAAAPAPHLATMTCIRATRARRRATRRRGKPVIATARSASCRALAKASKRCWKSPSTARAPKPRCRSLPPSAKSKSPVPKRRRRPRHPRQRPARRAG